MIALFATLLVGFLSLALSIKGVFHARKPVAVGEGAISVTQRSS